MPIIGGAIIGGGALLGSVAGGLIGGSASRSAANKAAAAQRYAVDKQYELAQQQRADYKPFYEMGTTASPYLQSLIYGKPVDGVDAKMNIQPSYAAQSQLRAYNNAMASRGLLGGGRGAWGSAEIMAADADRQYQQKLKEYMDLVNIGRGASTSMGQASQNLGNAYQTQATNLGNIYQTQGRNEAALYSGLGAMPAQLAGLGIQAYGAGLLGNGATSSNFTYNPSSYMKFGG